MLHYVDTYSCVVTSVVTCVVTNVVTNVVTREYVSEYIKPADRDDNFKTNNHIDINGIRITA